jgi:hypothetical protein
LGLENLVLAYVIVVNVGVIKNPASVAIHTNEGPMEGRRRNETLQAVVVVV